MNDPSIRPGNMVAATLMIGGILVVALPQHALSIAQIVIVASAVVTGLYALEVNVPATGWISPFKWMSPFRRRDGDHRGKGDKALDELRWIRRKLSGWRQPIQHGPPLPPETLGLLRPLIRTALDLSSEHNGDLASIRGELTPGTWAILASEGARQPYWFQMIPPNEKEVAETVHRVLDEIQTISAGTGPFPPRLDPRER
jgi:hypothetical protein